MNNSVRALAVSRNHLYAGGGFTTAGGTPANYGAKARIGSVAESISASGSSATIRFSGVDSYQYHVQRTDSLTPSMTWTTLTTTPRSLNSSYGHSQGSVAGLGHSQYGIYNNWLAMAAVREGNRTAKRNFHSS